MALTINDAGSQPDYVIIEVVGLTVEDWDQS